MNLVSENSIEELKSLLSGESQVRQNEPMSTLTTFGTGGCADLFVEVGNESDLREALLWSRRNNVPVYIVGRGSNLLVRDSGVRGVVIRLRGEWFERVIVKPPVIECGAGAKLRNLAMEAMRAGIGGLEFLEGIPGSVGGALKMNAGAMGNEIFNLVEKVRAMTFCGEIIEISGKNAGAEYRRCTGLADKIALDVVLRGTIDSPEAIEQRMKVFSQRRRNSQPKARSAGCVFKNPPGFSAGRLIDELGLKGLRVGGAMVSQEHGNFIVNTGNASSKDILALAEMIRERVRAERGVGLEFEIEIIGED